MAFQGNPIQLVEKAAVVPVHCLQYTEPELFMRQEKLLPAVEGRYGDSTPFADPGHGIRSEKVSP